MNRDATGLKDKSVTAHEVNNTIASTNKSETKTFWTSDNASAITTLQNDGDKYGNYTKIINNTNGGQRNSYVSFDKETVKDILSGTYIVEFDTLLSAATNASQLVLMADDCTHGTNQVTENAIWKDTATECKYIWEINATNSTTWNISNGDTVVIPKEWVHIKTTINRNSSIALLEISGLETDYSGYIKIPTGVSAKIDGINLVAGKTDGSICIDNIKVVNAYKNFYDDISEYRGETKSYPAESGEVFAGWYQDAKFNTPITEDTKTGSAYAKFVDADILSVHYQLPTSTSNGSKVRLMTGVDGLDYEKVGFIVKYKGGTKTADLNSTTVYKTVTAHEGDTYETEKTYNAEGVFGAGTGAKYILPYTITDISASRVFEVTPYWVTLDGTTVTGTSRDDITVTV